MDASTQAWVCELTPGGRGAIAAIGVRGPFAQRALAKHLRVLNKPFPVGNVAYAIWHREGERGDEGIVVTCVGGDTFEIQVHGGSAAIRNVLKDLHGQGCEIVDTARWFELTESNRIRAICKQQLIQTRTAKMTSFVLKQYDGLLESAFEQLIDLLKGQRVEESIETVQRLLSSAELGIHATKPWKVVLAGPPNVGKSSLLNAMVGYQRSIVSPVPGTTRDALGAELALDGWPVQMEDVAGIHDADDLIELAGIGKAKDRIAEADLVLLVVDVTQGIQSAHDQVIQLCSKRVLGVLNKCDLVRSPCPIPPWQGAVNWVHANAVNPAGCEALLKCIAEQLIPSHFSSDEPRLIEESMIKDLQFVLHCLEQGEVEQAESMLKRWLVNV